MSCLSLLSNFFTERPLRRGTSSLSYFFSEQPLVWAPSALGCLPATCSQPKFSSSRSQHSAFSNLQLQTTCRAAVTMCFATSSCNPTLRVGCDFVHTPPTSSSKSALRIAVFELFERQIELSLQSCALFVGNFPRSSRGPTETETLYSL